MNKNKLVLSAYKIWSEISKECRRQRNAAFHQLAKTCEQAGTTVDNAREMYYGANNKLAH